MVDDRPADPGSCLTMRAWIRADNRGDPRQRVGGPEVDRREQRTGDRERRRIKEVRVVIATVPVARGEIDERVVGRVRGAVGGLRVIGFEAPVCRPFSTTATPFTKTVRTPDDS